MTVEKQPHEVMKIAVVGNTCVGKTSYIQSLIKKKASITNSPTMGISFNTIILEDNNKIVKVNIWDTAGQDRFRSIIKLYLKNVDGIILMYDIFSPNVNEELSEWIDIINNECGDIYTLVIVNKLDLEHEHKEANIKKGEIFCLKNNIMFDRMSVKSYDNVYESIFSLVHTIRDNPDNKEIRDIRYKDHGIDIIQNIKRENTGSCC